MVLRRSEEEHQKWRQRKRRVAVEVSFHEGIETRTLSNIIHKDKFDMDLRPNCKTRNYKPLRRKHRQNTVSHKS